MQPKSPAWSLGTRRQPTLKQNSPGPGNYPTKSSFQDMTKIPLMSKAPRHGLSKSSEFPGPGRYELPTCFKAHPKKDFGYFLFRFGLSKREVLPKPANSPGPGYYNSKLPKRSPSFSLYGRLNKSVEKTADPGPGQYQPNDSYSTLQQPKYGLGTEPRKLKNLSPNTPGPGNYDLRTFVGELPSWGFGYGKSRQSVLRNGIPGPGTYNMVSSNSGKAYSLGPRRSLQFTSGQKTPGPGSYKVPQMNMTQTFSLGKSSRTPAPIYKEQPGPGSYYPKQFPSRRSNKLGTAKRPDLARKSDTPGPGSYTSRFPPSPTVKIPEIYPKVAVQILQPGPGHYSPEDRSVKESSPSWGLKPRRNNVYEFKQSQMKPGPGQYKVEARNESPKWGFGTPKQPVIIKGNLATR